METTQEIKVTIQEVAKTLRWKYEDARAVKRRKSPKERFRIYSSCEEKLIEARRVIMEEFHPQ